MCTMNRLFFTILFVLLVSGAATRSEQHPVVEQIIEQYPTCSGNHLLSLQGVQSKNIGKLFYDATHIVKNDRKFRYHKNFELIPLNNCVFRGNRYFSKYLQILQRNLNIKRIINLDLLIHKSRDERKYSSIDYKYLYINPSQYPHANSLRSLTAVLDALSQATPDNRSLIVCFFGKHRTGLVSALYQFVGWYAEDPEGACEAVASERDLIFQFTSDYAQSGIFSYDISPQLKKFYKDFAQSVCEKRSYELLEGVSIKDQLSPIETKEL